MSRLLILFLFSAQIFAKTTILEQSPGLIRLKLTADTIRTTSHGDSISISSLGDLSVSDRNGVEIPAFKLSLFTDQPERATISVSVKKRISVPVRKPIMRAEPNSPVISGIHSRAGQDRYQFAPITHWIVTPIISCSNGMIEQFTEAELVIRYVPPTHRSRPISDFEKAIASTTLNPSEFFRKENARSRASSIDHHWVSPDENGVMFTVGGTPGTEQESDGSVDKLIKLTPAMVPSLGSAIPINEIAVWGSNSLINDSVTPEPTAIPSGLVKIPLILRDNNRDGLFNGSDQILFFAMGTNFWYRKNSGTSWHLKFDDFSAKRNFYITRSVGTVVQKASLPTQMSTPMTAGLQLISQRQCNSLSDKGEHSGLSSRHWVWTTLNSDNKQFTTSTKFPIFDPAKGTEARLILNWPYGNSFGSTSATVRFHPSGSSISIPTYGDSQSVAIPSGSEDFTFDPGTLISSPSSNNYIDFQGYTIRYYRNLSMKNSSKLRFYSADRAGNDTVGTYRISDIPAEFTALFRIDPFTETIELIDTISSGGTITWSDKKGLGYQYAAVSLSSAESPKITTISSKTPTQNRTFQVRNLHETGNLSDYMIITPPEFLAEAIKLAQHKKSTGRFTNPTVVTTDDIYREFSGGIVRPSAIRNFMVYVKNSWQNGEALSYLILLGIGHYDYKGVLATSGPNYIPPYISNKPAAIEDYFAYTLAGSAEPQFAVGRVPATSSAEINGFLDKLISMEGPTGDFAEWRNQHLLIADDDYQNENLDNVRDHWIYSDSVGRTILANAPATNIRKVTLFEYERNGFEKPGAKDAVINYINSGIGAMNYFGHGSIDLMADEKIFSLDVISKLSNYQKYLIFTAFSCSVGFFDIPGRTCIAGKLITEPNLGAVAAIASTRESYSSENFKLANAFFQNYYSAKNLLTIGTAYIAAKVKQNTTSYALFGDPSYRPLAENRTVSLTVKSADGTEIDTIKGAQRIIIKAKIPSGSAIDSVRIQIQNPELKNRERQDKLTGPAGTTWKYSIPGSIIVNRAVAVSGDSISVVVKVPPNGAVPLDSMILRLYGWNDSLPQTCTGFKSLTYNGIDPNGLDTTDNIGPSIAARVFQDTSLADTALPGSVENTLVINGFPKDSNGIDTKPAVVELYFSDSSSVQTSGDLPGEGITISVPGIRTGKNYNGEFQQIQEDPNRGRILLYFKEKEFPQAGTYKMIVSAGDILNNRSQKEFTLDIKSLNTGIYEIGDFYAYPSPVNLGETTRFYFNTPANGGVSKATLKIFTLSGQLIRQFNDVRPGVIWDLTDQAGNRLSPNVYLYRLYIERTGRPAKESYGSGGDKEQIRSEIRKMVIYPPR